MGHLLAIAIGPVQEFIRAARRTRDLWFGSYLLSEISKAAAQAVQEKGGRLIFPPAGSDLNPDSSLNVANVVLAELPSGDPKEVASHAKKATQQRWQQFAEEAYCLAQGVIREEVWRDQVNDVLEFYAAWVRQDEDYPATRARLMRLLAGRKNCRDFLPAKGRAGVPKSSLDGQRETVLKDPSVEPWPEDIRRTFRLSGGEQLDVIGVVKRIAGGQRPYPSISRVAADPWIRGHQAEPEFQELCQVCRTLAQQGALYRLNTKDYPQYKSFPYEGTALFPSRHHEWEEECAGLPQENLKQLKKILATWPEVSPYVAVLVADGDRMGAAIAALPDAERNREFSRALAHFANKAQQIVQEHYGVLVYAGGDDVLAFVPVDQCLPCARQLHDQFADQMASYQQPTLSVGIAIGHFMENLEDLLDYGRAAEQDAKRPDRDGLAVHLYKRGGAPVRIRGKWNTHPDDRLQRYAALILRQAIPGKLPYDLYRLFDLYNTWPEQEVTKAMQQDVLRVIADKQPKAGRQYMGEVRRVVEQLCQPRDLGQFCEELLIARQIAEACRQAGYIPNPVPSAKMEAAR